jgi:hypothetical protein
MNASSRAEANSNRLFLGNFFGQVRIVESQNRAGQDRGDLGGAGFR